MANDTAYTYEDVRGALNKIGIESQATVFIHSNIAFFGRCAGCQSGSDVANVLLRAIREQVGVKGTVVVPTFTYSFPRDEEFDPKQTNSSMGIFAETIRKSRGVTRSCDPIFSIAARGAKALLLTENLPNNSYCTDSAFGRLIDEDAIVLNMNLGPSSTLLHYAERMVGVPYRRDKTVSGVIITEGARRTMDWTFFVRDLSDDATAPNFTRFESDALRDGAALEVQLGRGRLTSIHARVLVERAVAGLNRDQTYLRRG